MSDNKDEVLNLLKNTMALTLIVGWVKGKGLWKECNEALKLDDLMK